MRFLVTFLVLGAFAGFACSGDSSVVMSVYNGTGGTSVATGGAAGGIALIPLGGTGGGATTPYATGGTGSTSVVGGVRDPATAQCTTTSAGGGCPVDSGYLQCMKGSCGANLTKCYQMAGGIGNASGPCSGYATCMLACPCNSGRSTCENTCLQKYVQSDLECGICLYGIAACSSTYGCTLPTTCKTDIGLAVPMP